MKPRIAATRQEIVLRDDDVIVTKTDLTGRITYANRAFMRVANYPETAFLGKQHNIVRHPDMPRGAFRLCWDTMREFSARFAEFDQSAEKTIRRVSRTKDRAFGSLVKLAGERGRRRGGRRATAALHTRCRLGK